MKVKEFFRLTKGKVILFILISVLGNLPHMGYYHKIVMCFAPPCYPLKIPNLIFYPFYIFSNNNSWLMGNLLVYITHVFNPPFLDIRYSFIYLGIIIAILFYWYLLSCLIIFIFNKIRGSKNEN